MFALDGTPFSVTFNDLIMDVNDSGNPTTFDLNGGMDASCFGGAVTVSTAPLLSVPGGAICPTSGTITINAAAGTGQIVYPTPDCLDPRLFMCVA